MAKSLLLTPSQLKIYNTLHDLLQEETVICLTGPTSSGKKIIVDQYLSTLNKKIFRVDINMIVPKDTYSLFDLRKVLDDINIKSREYDILYLRDFERALQITTSYKFRLCIDVANIFVNFLNNLKVKTIAICSISNGKSLISENIWSIQLKINEEDRISIIENYTDLEKKEKDKIISYSKGNNLKSIMVGIKRSKRLHKSEPDKTFSQHFLDVLSLMENACVNLDKIDKPKNDIDMVGLEHIIEIIEDEVIRPIELNNKLIPLCRGILLYGPPGTGKTTICRWLAHRLKGKVFSVENDVNLPFSTSLKKAIDRAIENAPAIVVIDEIVIEEIYKRNILTLLDGISSINMSRITIVATTMDISKFCESYIRGRRFERCIKFEYPTINMIKSILEKRFQLAIEGLKEKHLDISNKLSPCLNKKNLNLMSSIVNGCSPATIHYTIDVVIRQASIPRKEYDPIDTFTKIAEENKITRNKTCKVLDDSSEDKHIYT